MSETVRKSTKLSRFVWSDTTTDPTYHRLSKPYALYREMYGMMLIEDARAFPYDHGDGEFVVLLEQIGENPRWPNLVVSALDRDSRSNRRTDGRLYSGDLEDALRKFSEVCLQQVLMFGEAAYEIVYSDPDDHGRWQAFHLSLVHPYRRSLGRHRHYKAQIGDERGEWITLPDDRVVVFRIEPAAYRHQVADSMAAVVSGSKASGSFMGMIGKVTRYDFSKHQNSEQVILARATRSLGWTGRGLYVKEGLPPYLAMRTLQFALFQVHLREMVVRGVQAALVKAGDYFGVQSTLQVSGVPSRADIENARKSIEVGPGTDKSLYDVERSCRV